jgi:uncharacterized membrane protein YdjX (TVP38/TMEM64 family)
MLFLLTLAAILVPFFLFGERIEQATTRFLNSGAGRWAIAGALSLLLALDVVLPVPSSLASIAAGAMLGFWGGLASSWTGMTAGCVLGYFLGSRVPSSGDIDRVRKAQERYGDAVLVLFRAVPVMAEASVLFAGITRMPWRRFLWLTSLSNLGISLVYVGTAVYSTQQGSFLLAFAGAAGIPAVALLVTRALRIVK